MESYNNIEKTQPDYVRRFNDVYEKLKNNPLDGIEAKYREDGRPGEEDTYHEIIMDDICIGMNTISKNFFIKDNGNITLNDQNSIYGVLDEIFPLIEARLNKPAQNIINKLKKKFGGEVSTTITDSVERAPLTENAQKIQKIIDAFERCIKMGYTFPTVRYLRDTISDCDLFLYNTCTDDLDEDNVLGGLVINRRSGRAACINTYSAKIPEYGNMEYFEGGPCFRKEYFEKMISHFEKKFNKQ